MSFWYPTTKDTATEPKTAPEPTQTNKVALYQAEAKKAQEEADKANSFWGLTKATLLGLPKAGGQTIKEIGQSSWRGFGALGAKIAEGDINAKFTPQGQFQQDLYGTKESVDFSSLGKEVTGKDIPVVNPLLGAFFATADAIPGGQSTKKGVKTVIKTADKISDATKTAKLPTLYKGEKDLTTKILKDLEGKTTVSRKYIEEATNRGDLKQVERDLIRNMLADEPATVDVSKFAKKVKAELLPLERQPQTRNNPKAANFGSKYESISLPDDIKGNVKNYSENIYQSPIQTSAGSTHFGQGEKNYFGHTRIEDMADNKTRRVIEVQSDLYQKGNLEREAPAGNQIALKNRIGEEKYLKDRAEFEKQFPSVNKKAEDIANKEYQKLQQYNDPTAHFRMIREEIKKAAQDGKTKLQFPTGETAMKIEGLGQADQGFQNFTNGRMTTLTKPQDLVVGKEVIDRSGSNWIITDVLGDGKFKAVPKEKWDDMDAGIFLYSGEEKRLNELWGKNQSTLTQVEKIERDALFKKADQLKESFQFNREIPDTEQFDISGKVDTNNPIYKFYEKDVQKYLNKFGGKRVVDENSVEWIEVPITKGMEKAPVEAFGAFGGIEQDEEGNISFDPMKAALGVGALHGFNKAKGIIAKTTPSGQTRPPLEKKVLLPEKAGLKTPPLSPQKSLKSETLDILNQTPAKKASILKRVKDNIVEYVQDKEQAIKNLVNRKDVKVTDVSDPYLKSTLYSGRVANQIELAKTEAQTIVNEAKKLGDLKTARKEINDFLIARHAPERNLALGDNASGMTTLEASQKLKVIKDSPQGAKIEEIANKVQELNNKTLDTLRDGGVITDELYDTLRKKYKNHVPLNRVFEETEDVGGALSGNGFDVRSTGIKSAKGSEREVSDILGNVIHNYEQAVLRAEKNIVDNATLKFVKDNKSVLDDLFEIQHPKAKGTDFSGKPILETTTDPQTLQMFDKGKKVWIKIKDPQLAIALRGIGKEKLGPILNAVGTFTRFYSGLATRFNPEFALPNKIRDLQETMVYLSSRKEIGGVGAFKTAVKDPQSIKDITDFMRGKNTTGANLYKEMKAQGGTTGGFGLSTKAKVELDIKKLESLANSKTKKVANNLIEYVDNWNTIFEDSTRLSVYKQALKQGLSKEKAAFLAKEASINFNRMGKGGPVINALYMFSNASIQGSAKMLRAMKNPKVAASVATVVVGAVASVSEWNDKVDPEWRDKVPKWDRLNGLPVVIPSSEEKFKYITIPVSWGLKPIKVMSDYAYDMASGHKYSTKEVMENVMTATLESYNPAGGTDITSAITPTILDVPFEISRNKSWTGKSIKPDFDKNAPADIQYYDSLKDTATGRTAISLTELLQKGTGVGVSPADVKYAYDSYIGGAGRFISKIFNVGSGALKKDPVPIDEYPFVSRFYRETPTEEIYGSKTEEIKPLLENQSRERFNLKQEALKLDEELQALQPEEARARFAQISSENPQLASKLKDVAEERKLGLTYEEKQMKQLGVENGERAKYIHEQIMKLPQEQRAKYYEELKTKKVISDNVAKQLIKLNEKS